MVGSVAKAELKKEELSSGAAAISASKICVSSSPPMRFGGYGSSVEEFMLRDQVGDG